MSETFAPLEQPKPKNIFGLPIYEIKDVLTDPEIDIVIHTMCHNVFQHLGISDERAKMIIRECFDCAQSYDDITEYEYSAYSVLAREGITGAIPEKLKNRAHIMRRQISPHLAAGFVFDLGCGDARLAQLLAQDGFTLQLADVYENPNVVSTGMPFQLLKQNETIPFSDHQFDNTLLCTVLHHSDNPMQVLCEARRVTRPNGRVIVIESVYGVNGQELLPAQCAQIQQYLSLTPEQQRRVNIFFDHFYNRVIHFTDDPAKKVNVPFNFNTPEMWRQLFEQAGLRQERVIHLGVDQPTVPEYHTLHILT